MGILDKFSLKGRIALVSGGAGPLFGSSISEALAEAGATLISASRSLERNEAFAEGLRHQGYEAHALQLDITSTESIAQVQARVLERFGRLDVLVNSAVVARGGGFEEQTPDYWDFSAQGNMVGLFSMCKAFVPGMVAQGRGSIINISSIYGVVANDPSLYEGTGMKQPPDYTFVKAGMINFTRYLANYYGKSGVRANCLCPGGYYNDQPEPFLANYTKRCPIGRMLDNEDIKGAAVFLASDASAYITGATLMVDGGWTAL
ncbi:MAG: SDR family oxidoreductase [Candidatus Latescibacteria bacterium]|nr:SDR family oxidoreductase [Candidatus Latescibacterota bacterium]